MYQVGAFPNFRKLFVPVRTAGNVNVVSRPMGLKTLTYDPTDKSVGYFHLSLRDKT